MKRKSNSTSGLLSIRVLFAFLLCASAVSLAVFSLAASPAPRARNRPSAKADQSTPRVRLSAKNGTSPKVSDLPRIAPSVKPPLYLAEPVRRIHPPRAELPLPVQDSVQQTAMSIQAMSAPLITFEGMNQAEGCGGCIPPDPNGAVGPNHYVEMVNSAYSIYNKSGTRLVGPVNINKLWMNLPGRCQTDNDGDPVVVYDHLANRWVLSQFAVNGGSGPFAQCIAVSQTPDPTGAYYVYEFDQDVFNDYPKLGVWPDAYYMTVNQFGGTGGTFSGAGAYAYERPKMLLGQPAREVFFDEGPVDSTFGGMLPSHLDGQPPPAGSPNYFAEVDSQVNSPSLGADAMRIFKFHVDWSVPTNSTFGLGGQPNSILPVAMWAPSQCVEAQGTCVPQMGSPYQLDVLGDRLMFRLVYRNFGDHEALVLNHSVIADARIGVRWYEVRSPGSSPVIYQQSTYAPVDALYRWMGSAAFDHLGNIAIAYSTSSAAAFPSLAYSGRLAGDPLNALSQGEMQLWAGAGSENVAFYVPPVGRWGDYSDLTVDPTDDCTFWYVNEYFGSLAEADPGAPWQTRIGSFKFPTCVASPVQIASVVSRKVHGNAGTFDINLPTTGNPGSECRSGGANGNFTVVFTFVNILTNVAEAKVTSGTATISGSGIGNNPHEYIVTLTGVANAQTITVSLTNVYDAAGNSSSAVSAPMSVLLGDTTANKSVNSSDVAQTQAQSGQVVSVSNFREDVTVNGSINSSDVAIVQQQSGTALP